MCEEISSSTLAQMQSNTIGKFLLLELAFREIVIHMTTLVLKQGGISLNVAEMDQL